jgi:hypothetical protein
MVANVDGRRLLGQVDDGGAARVLLHRGDAVLGRCLGFVGLTGRDDLTVTGLEPKRNLPALSL